MSIEFHCQKCSKLLRVPDGSAGKKAQCPSCQTILEIPTASAPPKADPFAAPAGPTGPGSSGSGAPTPSGQGTSPFSGPGSFAPPGQTPPPTPPPLSDNPFVSPTAASEHLQDFASARGPIVPTRIHFDLLGKTWNVFSANLGAFLLMGLMLIGLTIAAYVVFFVAIIVLTGVLQGLGQGAAPNIAIMIPLMVLFYLVLLVGGCWIYLGTIKFCIRIVRGESHNFGDLFSGGRYLLRGVGIGFFQIIATYGLLFVCMAPGFALGNEVLTIGGQLLGSVLNFFVILLFGPAMCLIVDQNLGVFRSIGTSFNIMRGNILVTLALWFVTCILGGIVVVITCGLGYIAMIPFLALTLVMIYLGA